MGKIPVGETIAHAYNFAFGHFLRLLGITWAPLLVSIAFGMMITPGYFGHWAPLTDHDEIMRQSLRLVPLSLIVSLFIRAMIANGVTELALGQRPGAFVYFSVGPAVWRFIGAWLLLILVMIVLSLGLGIALGITLAIGGVALGAMGQGGGGGIAAGIAVFLLVLGFFCAIIYIQVRLTFLLPPVIVSERKIDLARGWQLTKGNFWRIFVIGLAIFIPLFLIGLCVFIAFFGTAFFTNMADIFMLAMHQAKQNVIQQHTDAMSAQMRTQGLTVWPFTAAISVITETVAFGLTYGASAFAYREITGASQDTGMKTEGGMRG